MTDAAHPGTAHARTELTSATLEAVRAGDPEASRAWVEALYPLVLRIVRSHRPQPSLEEDLAQEVFLKLFSRLDQYRPQAGVPFEHWVSRVAVHTCLDKLRSERRRAEVRSSDLSEEERAWVEFLAVDDAGSSAASGTDFAAVELMRRLIEALPAEDRLVIQWLDLEQRSTAEIAAHTGWSRAAVKVRAFRARHRLRRQARELLKGTIS